MLVAGPPGPQYPSDPRHRGTGAREPLETAWHQGVQPVPMVRDTSQPGAGVLGTSLPVACPCLECPGVMLETRMNGGLMPQVLTGLRAGPGHGALL